MSEWECLRWTEDDRKAILKTYDRTPETARRDIDAIREWAKKQPHLHDRLDKLPDRFIETQLLMNKFRVETTKGKLDMYFSIRKYFPEYFAKMHNRYLERSFLGNHIAMIPNLTKDRCRVFMCRLHEPHRELYDVNDYMIRVLKMAEVRSRHDYCLAEYYVIDCKWSTFSQMAQVTPMACKKMVTVINKLYSMRCTTIYFLNAPRAAEQMVALFKKFLKPKIADRIHVSETEDVLRELLPIDDLPKEYGGNGESLADLSKRWQEKFEEIDDWLEYLWANPPDESLRPGEPLDCEYFGIDGNFRRLEVD